MPSSARCTNFREGRPAAAQREAIQYDNHPDEVGTICHGTAVTGIAESPSVPEGQVKSALAPIRRPPSRAEGHCTGARLAPFSLPPGAAQKVNCPAGAREAPLEGSLFGQDQKENGGAPRMDNAPWREPDPRGRRSAARTPPGMPLQDGVIPPASPSPGGSMPPGHRPRQTLAAVGHW